MAQEWFRGLRVSPCLTKDVSISVKKKLNIQKCEIPLEPMALWLRRLALHMGEGGLLPARHSALNTFHRHIHISH